MYDCGLGEAAGYVPVVDRSVEGAVVGWRRMGVAVGVLLEGLVAFSGPATPMWTRCGPLWSEGIAKVYSMVAAAGRV